MLVRIEAANGAAAQSRVHEIMALADKGHELYDISGTWTTGNARELSYDGPGPATGRDDRARARSWRGLPRRGRPT